MNIRTNAEAAAYNDHESRGYTLMLKSQKHCGPEVYRLAAEREFELVPFGPLMTLSEASAYRDILVKQGKPVHVINAMGI